MPVNRARIQERAEKLERQGKLAAAIAEYRILLDDQPNDIATLNRMGDLLVRAGKGDEANDLFDRVAHLYTLGGFFHKAIAIYKKILKIDPGTLEPRLRLADLYARRDLTTEARGEYLAVVDRLVALGEHGRAREVHERLVRMEPAILDTRTALADTYLRRGDGPRAIVELRAAARAMEALSLVPGCLAIHRRILGQAGAEPGSFLESVRALVRLGDVEEGIRAARSIRERFPQEALAHEALIEALELGGERDAVEALVTGGGAGDGPMARLVKGRLQARAGEKSAGLALMVDAAKALAGEGWGEAAEAALGQVLEIDADNEEALRLLHELAESIAPVGAVAFPERESSDFGEMAGDPVVRDVLDAEPTPSGNETGLEGLGRPLTREERDFLSEHLTEAEVFVKYGLYDKAIEPLNLVLSRFPTHLEAHIRLKGIHADQGNRGRVVHECLAIADLHERGGSREDAIKALTEAKSLDPENQAIRTRLENLQGAPPRRSPRSFVEPGPPSRGGDLEISVEDDSARTAQGAASKGERSAGDPPAGRGDGLLDLTGELAKTLADVMGEEGSESHPPGETREFDDVLKAFRDKVAEEVDISDFGTHYQLGIAYKEMGLLDEAVGELEHAAEDPGRLIECAAMLGLCFRQKGMPGEAERWYARALASGLGSADQELGLRFELAETYMEMGEVARAKDAFAQVAKIDKSYRNVRARLEEVDGIG